MKLLYVFIVFFVLQNCSFDNKTGIWKNENTIIKTNSKKGIFDEFENLSTSNEIFQDKILINPKFRFSLTKPLTNNEWKDIYFRNNNNLINFKYNQTNKILFKSKKVTKYNINDFILFDSGKLITSDQKGNLIIYSIKKRKLITKFNFYKKQNKKTKKYLNLAVEKNVVYVSDNIGYIYAYSLKTNRIIWAKNYKIPFRGNLKILKKKIITSNQNKNLFIFDKLNGEILRLIPTEETIIKNKFKNNLASTDKSLYFLNTFGSLYKLNINSSRIEWFINLNKSTNLSINNLFFGNAVVVDSNTIVISSNEFTYIIDSNTGSILYKKNFSSKVRPIILNNFLFLTTKRDFLIAFDLRDGSIIYSNDIKQDIADFLDTKKKTIEIKNINIVNNNIYIFLENSYLLKYDIYGNLGDIRKLPSKINSQPLFIENSMLYLNKDNKIIIVD